MVDYEFGEVVREIYVNNPYATGILASIVKICAQGQEFFLPDAMMAFRLIEPAQCFCHAYCGGFCPIIRRFTSRSDDQIREGGFRLLESIYHTRDPIRIFHIRSLLREQISYKKSQNLIRNENVDLRRSTLEEL